MKFWHKILAFYAPFQLFNNELKWSEGLLHENWKQYLIRCAVPCLAIGPLGEVTEYKHQNLEMYAMMALVTPFTAVVGIIVEHMLFDR